MKRIQFTSIILLIFFSLKLNAQDIHFSQFWNTPLLQNPSFAGKSEGDIRAIVNHKSQWRSVTSSNFKTYGANFDMRIHTKSKDNFFGAGIFLYTDVAGASKMRTTLGNLAASYHLKINAQNYVSGGIQAGINQIDFDPSDLRFDNQFEETGHNAAINSNEIFNNRSQIKPTVSAGISYMWSNSFGRAMNGSNLGKKSLNVGLAVHHFNSPRFDFVKPEKLGLKYITTVEASFNNASSAWTVKPAAFLVIQNNATDILLGSLFKYAFNSQSRKADPKKSGSLALGGYYRFGDALIPTLQIQWSVFSVDFSYDLNLSKLSSASKGDGGFEIGLKYIAFSSPNGRKSRASYF